MSHKKYGIKSLPEIRDIFPNKTIVIPVNIVIKTAITNDSLIFFIMKNKGLQMIFKNNCKQKKVNDNFFIRLVSLEIIIKTEQNIKTYKIGQTILNTIGGGVNDAFLSFL